MFRYPLAVIHALSRIYMKAQAKANNDTYGTLQDSLAVSCVAKVTFIYPVKVHG